jgi:O-antigen/teichoic acid export membrane protein
MNFVTTLPSSPKLSLLGQFGKAAAGSPLAARLARGAFWSIAGSLISRGLGFASSILVARLLGKESFGELGIIQNTISMFGMLAGFGMGLTANKHVAEFKESDPARAGSILGVANATAWISSSIMAAVLLLAGSWLAKTTLRAPQLGSVIQLGSVLLLLSGVNGAQTGALSGFEAFRAIARINLISGALSFPATLCGAYFWGLTGAVVSLILIQAINCLLCSVELRREMSRYRIKYSYAGWRDERRLFWNFSLPAVLTGVLNSVVAWGAGALVVNQIHGYSDYGIYNAALRVKLLPETLVLMLVAPMLPILTDTYARKDLLAFKKALLVNFSLAVAIITPLSLAQAAAPWLTLRPFGIEYQGQSRAVQWLMLHGIIYSLVFPMSNVLISMGRMWFGWFVNFLFALLYAALALLWVPRYGVAGYALAQALAFGLANAPCILFLYRELPAVMHFLRWALLATVAGCLFIASLVISQWLSHGAALALGAIGAGAFLASLCLSHLRSVTPR